MTTPEETERLIEATVSAYRERDPHGRIVAASSFFDLSESDREAAFDEALRAREIEAALDPAGMSSTARAILARIT